MLVSATLWMDTANYNFCDSSESSCYFYKPKLLTEIPVFVKVSVQREEGRDFCKRQWWLKLYKLMYLFPLPMNHRDVEAYRASTTPCNNSLAIIFCVINDQATPPCTKCRYQSNMFLPPFPLKTPILQFLCEYSVSIGQTSNLIFPYRKESVIKHIYYYYIYYYFSLCPCAWCK